MDQERRGDVAEMLMLRRMHRYEAILVPIKFVENLRYYKFQGKYQERRFKWYGPVMRRRNMRGNECLRWREKGEGGGEGQEGVGVTASK